LPNSRRTWPELSDFEPSLKKEVIAIFSTANYPKSLRQFLIDKESSVTFLQRNVQDTRQALCETSDSTNTA